MKPILYIDPEGTLLIGGEHPDRFLEAVVAPGASSFMAWATKNFSVRWLTDRAPAHTFRLAEHLGLKGHEVPYTSVPDSKAHAIDPRSNFYWVDTHFSPMDIGWLTQHGNLDRVVVVNTPQGIGETHRTQLADKIKAKRR